MLVKNKKIILFVVALAIVSMFYSKAYAVKIIPPRLVLGPDVKIEYMFVKNNAEKKETYRFGWKHMAMDKEGNILNLDKIGMDKAPAGYQSLDKIIRFSPRRVILEPGQTQRITFMISRPQGLPAGEFRSHFLVERETEVHAQQNAQPDLESASTSNILPEAQTQPNLSENSAPKVMIDVSISRAVPIYVMNGETNATLSVLSAEIKKNTEKNKPNQPDYLAYFKVQKTGNRSVIGIATISCQSGGNEVVISKVSKVFAVYAEGEYRNENMAVELPSGGCSSYHIVIKGHPDDLLAGQIIADKTFK